MSSVQKRNGLIDLEKFIFAIIVVLYHMRTFYYDKNTDLYGGGYIAVEFYFMVSGYFIALKAKKYDGKLGIFEANIEQMKHRIKSIVPYLLLAGLTATLFYAIGSFDIQQLLQRLILMPVDTFGLQMFGFRGNIATGVSWYISALFIWSFILYPILCSKKTRKVFLYYIAPISIAFILGYLSYVEANISSPGKWLGIVFKGLLRGYADIALGMIACELKNVIDNKDYSLKNVIIYRIIETLSIIVVINYAIFHKYSDNYDFVIVFIAFVSVCISFSKFSIGNLKIFSFRCFNYLGLFSLSIYLNHYFVKVQIPVLLPWVDKTKLLVICWIIITVISLLNYFIGTLLIKTKKKELMYSLLAIFFIIACIPVSKSKIILKQFYKTHANYSGVGTWDDPILINNERDIRLLALIVNSGESYSGTYFLQTCDIDLNNKEWVPIGTFEGLSYFDGIYNGNNKLIKNINISDNGKNNGLFGKLDGKVENLGIESGTINGRCVGAIASHGGDHSMIINCFNKADVHGSARAGGIVDNMGMGKVICCINEGKVSAKEYASQIVSYNASEINLYLPEKNAVNSNFKGTLNNVKNNKKTTYEQLNKYISYLNKKGYGYENEIFTWN